MTDASGSPSWKIVATILISAVAFLVVGWAANVDKQLDSKAAEATVNLQYNEVTKRLDRIENKLDHMMDDRTSGITGVDPYHYQPRPIP